MYKTLEDVFQNGKSENISWIMIQKDFTFNSLLFKSGQVFYVPARVFETRRDSVTIYSYPDGTLHMLPFNMEGNFVKCHNTNEGEEEEEEEEEEGHGQNNRKSDNKDSLKPENYHSQVINDNISVKDESESKMSEYEQNTPSYELKENVGAFSKDGCTLIKEIHQVETLMFNNI